MRGAWLGDGAACLAGRAGDAAVAGLDTTQVNRARHDFADLDSVWLFGYGSLIYKVDFPYIERRAAAIRGWTRRLWQGSHDHRGTPAHPGRVATLIAERDATCVGMAYRVAPSTFEQLDHREKNGYLRFATHMDFVDGGGAEGLVYVAAENNEAWSGPASARDIALQVATSSGPSGPNRDYVLLLADALRALGTDDAHIFAVESHLRELIASD